jgi:hypothetical protein
MTISNSSQPKMEIFHPIETQSQIVLSYDDLTNLIKEFVFYMDSQNQTFVVEDESIGANNKTVYSEIFNTMTFYMAKYGLPSEFPNDVDIFQKESSTIQCNTTGASKVKESLIEETSSFWLEGVLQTTFGILGIVGNLFALKIFCGKGNKFGTLFYKLLTCLLIVQTCFLGSSIGIYWGLSAKTNFTFNKMLLNGLYPMSFAMLHASTILTILLAWY